MKHPAWTRRDFIRVGTAAGAAGMAAKFTLLEPKPLWASPNPVAPSDTVRFASIGTGVRGCELLQASLRVPGIQCVAACDLYDSRHIAAQESVKNPSLPTTRKYQEILDRKDVDAVIVAVPDHWHRKIFEDACAAGKDVYCEKPMSHKVEDGFAMIAAAQKYNRMAQVGSQRVSSIVYAQAKQLYDSGQLGKVYSIEAYWDRNSPSGAWVYPIPPDATPETIDWNTFLGDAPKRPFSNERFFRWRCFSDYGEGLAGDLFVHLISGIHFITGGDKTNDMVASRAQSAGGLFHYKDGRDFPDLIDTLYDYPGFRVYLRCNLNNDQGEFIGFYGSEGTAIIRGASLTFTPQDTRPQPEAYSIYGWPAKLRDQYLADFEKEHPLSSVTINEATEVFGVPQGYSDLVDHEAHFFNAVRTRNKVVENEEFGNHAAIGCHLANYSYFNNRPAVWDAEKKRITG